VAKAHKIIIDMFICVYMVFICVLCPDGLGYIFFLVSGKWRIYRDDMLGEF
jgi:hypothetical protein